MKLSALAAEIDGADAAASNIKYQHYRQNEYDDCEEFRKTHGEQLADLVYPSVLPGRRDMLICGNHDNHKTELLAEQICIGAPGHNSNMTRLINFTSLLRTAPMFVRLVVANRQY